MAENKTVYEVLTSIQAELKAPKNQFNKFGGYNYRNCEDIMEAVKPLLYKYGASLVMHDTIELIGDRYYVKATATFSYKGETIVGTAYAREAEEKKGMDASQVTGATSSYARKYCLNGLFAIDDTKDADYYDNSEQAKKPEPKPAPKKPESKASKTEHQKEKKPEPVAETINKIVEDGLDIKKKELKKHLAELSKVLGIGTNPLYKTALEKCGMKEAKNFDEFETVDAYILEMLADAKGENNAD